MKPKQIRKAIKAENALASRRVKKRLRREKNEILQIERIIKSDWVRSSDDDDKWMDGTKDAVAWSRGLSFYPTAACVVQCEKEHNQRIGPEKMISHLEKTGWSQSAGGGWTKPHWKETNMRGQSYEGSAYFTFNKAYKAQLKLD